MRPRGRGCFREIPSPRRQLRLRRPRPSGSGLHRALSLYRRPRQLRLHRRRLRRRHALYRSPSRQDLPGHDDGYQQRYRRFHAQLRRKRNGTGNSAGPHSFAPRQRLLGDRRGHGHQHSSPQPRRSGGRHHRIDGRPGYRCQRSDEIHQRAGFPHLRQYHGERGHPRSLRHRPGHYQNAGQSQHRHHRKRQIPDHHYRAALSGQQKDPH